MDFLYPYVRRQHLFITYLSFPMVYVICVELQRKVEKSTSRCHNSNINNNNIKCKEKQSIQFPAYNRKEPNHRKNNLEKKVTLFEVRRVCATRGLFWCGVDDAGRFLYLWADDGVGEVKGERKRKFVRGWLIVTYIDAAYTDMTGTARISI